MSEDLIVKLCSPTLAGIKTANLFSCYYDDKDTLLCELRTFNKALSHKGICAVPVKFTDKKALIYIFRPAYLKRDLSDASAHAILEDAGYVPSTMGGAIAQLIKRLAAYDEFPHEIGLFLGYPPEDVRGFIDNKGCGGKCCGCWKVYGDADAAQKCFNRYKKCTCIYSEQFAKGVSIEKLTVAV